MDSYLYIFEDGLFAQSDRPPTLIDMQMQAGGYMQVVTVRDGKFYELDEDGNEILIGQSPTTEGFHSVSL